MINSESGSKWQWMPKTEVEAIGILPSLNVKTARSWRGTVVPYAPRTGGAHDSPDGAAGVAGRPRGHGGGGRAARGARTAAGDAGDRISQRRLARRCDARPPCRLSPSPG